ncbi:hypothetical protein J2848_005926 [Azospirillum lipoferum]|uniref:DUF6916 domain-containing protein n=1 Tax=Azospirillum lipoferum TaxID=193 RepID=A0A5A9GH30_AZOLI|nr:MULTISPECIES: hypothetical protein [Azospirillum]KAA0593731.1 hypothetical protein FZ942_22840 [Azospirillum lipoferum]MCP1614223.1 hypothetical protein [Azospirillum lipoferum]MDW5536908.1 hypothetical protein [Azospirillum sp. NL1]
MTDLSQLSAGLFPPHLNSVFTMTSEEGVEIEATLTACTENPRSTMPGSPRTAFSLFLQCPADGLPHFSGASFTVTHPQMPAFGPVYVERVMPEGGGSEQAVFQISFN